MSFLKRFGYYLVGLSIGLIFLAFFLRKKSDETGVEFCYLPNCRVLKDLRSKPLHWVESVGDPADSLAVRHLLKEGDVDFGSSDQRSEPCGIYVVNGKYIEVSLRLTLENCEDSTRIIAYETRLE